MLYRSLSMLYTDNWEVEHNQTPIEHNQTAIEHNQTTIEHNQTALEHNNGVHFGRANPNFSRAY